MAVYKFRVTFEDYDDVMREIEIRSNQTFEDLHRGIHEAIGFDGNFPSSFYMSNDYWHKGKEITLTPESIKDSSKTTLMSTSRLKDYIEDPHQKIYYIFNFDKPWAFYIELIRIGEVNPSVTYPLCTRVAGEAPKQFGNVPRIVSGNDDLDFLHETEIDLEGEEYDEMGIHDEEGEEEQEESTSPDAFSDPAFDEEDFQKGED